MRSTVGYRTTQALIAQAFACCPAGDPGARNGRLAAGDDLDLLDLLESQGIGDHLLIQEQLLNEYRVNSQLFLHRWGQNRLFLGVFAVKSN